MAFHLKKRRAVRRGVLLYCVAVVLVILWMFPSLAALKNSLIPGGPKNYIAVIQDKSVNYGLALLNSLIVASLAGLIVTVIVSMAAYAFSKLDFPGSRVIYALFLACLAIPSIAVTAPLFFTVKSLGLIPTKWSLIAPAVMFNAPLMLFIVKNYFDNIPAETLEAAKLDGASSWRLYVSVALPLGRPALINVFVLTFVYTWNDFLTPLLFGNSGNKYTLTLAVREFIIAAGGGNPEARAKLYAALILMAAPSVIIYLIFKREIQESVAATGIGTD